VLAGHSILSHLGYYRVTFLPVGSEKESSGFFQARHSKAKAKDLGGKAKARAKTFGLTAKTKAKAEV